MWSLRSECTRALQAILPWSKFLEDDFYMPSVGEASFHEPSENKLSSKCQVRAAYVSQPAADVAEHAYNEIKCINACYTCLLMLFLYKIPTYECDVLNNCDMCSVLWLARIMLHNPSPSRKPLRMRMRRDGKCPPAQVSLAEVVGHFSI